MGRVHSIFLDVFATCWSVGLYLKITNANRYRDTIGIQRIFTELNLEKGKATERSSVEPAILVTRYQ